MSDSPFDEYLRLGSMWPQLRTPLACAIGSTWQGQPWLRSLVDHRLNESQCAASRRRLIGLHRAYGVREVTSVRDVLHREWSRSVNAVVYTLLSVAGCAPHPNYDGHFNYLEGVFVDRLDQALHSSSLERCQLQKTFAVAREVFVQQGGLGRVFRSTFTTSDHPGSRVVRRYFAQMEPSAHDEHDYSHLRAAVRLHVLDRLASKLAGEIGCLGSGWRPVHALSLDQILFEQVRRDVNAER